MHALVAGRRRPRFQSARRLFCRLGAGSTLAALMCVPPAAQAYDFDEAGHTDVQLSIEPSRGGYGSPETTRIVQVPLVVRHRRGPWTGQIEVPLVRVDSVEELQAGSGAVGPKPPGERRVETGLGDVWLKLTYEAVEFTRDSAGIDLTLKLKTRTGDFERGLGTGGTDVALQVEGFGSVGPLTAFGHVGYRRTGDLSGYRPYADPWYGELGLFGHPVTGCDLGGYYDYRQPIGSLGALSEVTFYGACRDGAARVQLYLTHGFKPASPDIAIGLSYRYRF